MGDDRQRRGTFTIVSLIALCSCLFCIVYMLQIIMKGAAARAPEGGWLQRLPQHRHRLFHHHGAVLLHHHLHLTLAPVSFPSTCFPSPSAPTSAPPSPASCPPPSSPPTSLNGWQVALAHLFFNIFGTLICIPSPRFVRFPSRLPGSSATACPPPVRHPFPLRLHLHVLHHPRHRVRHRLCETLKQHDEFNALMSSRRRRDRGSSLTFSSL